MPLKFILFYLHLLSLAGVFLFFVFSSLFLISQVVCRLTNWLKNCSNTLVFV